MVCVDRGGVGVTNHPSEQLLFSSGLGGTGLSAAEIAKRLLAHGVRIGPESETSMRAVTEMLSYLDKFEFWFNIVTP